MCFEKTNEKSCVACGKFILNMFIAMIVTGLYIPEMWGKASLRFIFSLSVRTRDGGAARFLCKGKRNKTPWKIVRSLINWSTRAMLLSSLY